MDPAILPMSVAEHEAMLRLRRCEAQLESDLTAVLGVKAALARSNTLCQEIVDKLSTVQEKVVEIEDRLGPLAKESAAHTRVQRNIPLLSAELERVDALFELSHEAENRLRYGPGQGPGSIGAYITTLDDVKEGLTYFSVTDPDGLEQYKLSEQLTVGVNRILKAFRKIVESGRLYTVAIMLDLAANHDQASSSHTAEFTVFSEDGSQGKLSRVAKWLDRTEQMSELVKVYAETRSSALLEAMTALQDYLRPQSHGQKSRESKCTSFGTPTPDREARARGQSTRSDSPWKCERSAAGVSTAVHSARIHPRGRSLHSKEENSGNSEGIDSNLLATMFAALCKILQAERSALESIIPTDHQQACLHLLSSAAVDILITEGERFSQSMKRCPSHSPRGVLASLSALKQIQPALPGYQAILHGFPDGSHAASISDLVEMLKDVCHKSLIALAESVKIKSACFQTLPADGTVHELTCSTVNFVLECTDLTSTIDSLLLQFAAPQDEVAAPPVCLGICRDSRAPPHAEQSAVRFLSEVINGLGRSLSTTPLAYEPPALQLVFRMNNLNYMLKFTRTAPAGLVDAGVAAALGRLLHLHQQSYFRTVWKASKDSLTVPKWLSTDKLSKRQRGAIKEKLLGFNKELNDIAVAHHSYVIPDSQLRQQIRERNHDLIVPDYAEFLHRVEHVAFTKKPKADYIVHDASDVAAILSTFFDGSS